MKKLFTHQFTRLFIRIYSNKLLLSNQITVGIINSNLSIKKLPLNWRFYFMHTAYGTALSFC